MQFYWCPSWSGCWFVKDEIGEWWIVSHSPDAWEDRLRIYSPPSHVQACDGMPTGMLEWLGMGLDLGRIEG